jgi:hypothetical protein
MPVCPCFASQNPTPVIPMSPFKRVHDEPEIDPQLARRCLRALRIVRRLKGAFTHVGLGNSTIIVFCRAEGTEITRWMSESYSCIALIGRACIFHVWNSTKPVRGVFSLNVTSGRCRVRNRLTVVAIGEKWTCRRALSERVFTGQRHSPQDAAAKGGLLAARPNDRTDTADTTRKTFTELAFPTKMSLNHPSRACRANAVQQSGTPRSLPAATTPNPCTLTEYRGRRPRSTVNRVPTIGDRPDVSAEFRYPHATPAGPTAATLAVDERPVPS